MRKLTLLLTVAVMAIGFSASSAFAVTASQSTNNGSTWTALPNGATVNGLDNGSYTFVASNGTVTCTTSSVSGTLGTNGANPIDFTVNSMSFTGCTDTMFFGNIQSVVVNNLPYSGDLTKTAMNIDNVNVTLDFDITDCTYTDSQITGTTTDSDGFSAATAQFSNQSLSLSSGGFGCPSTGAFTGKYTLSYGGNSILKLV